MSKDDEIKALQERNAELEAQLSRAKIVKEYSDFFRKKDTDEAISFKSLSETKKYFETRHEDVLKAMCSELSVEMLTSEQFHEKLAEYSLKASA